tara:strand:+ start:328 stop:528 length:201 start_codon:yes stop_codon:yes gene_type:complete
MLKTEYAREAYNRIGNFRTKTEDKPSSGLLSRSKDMKPMQESNDLNFVSDLVHNIKMKNPKGNTVV